MCTAPEVTQKMHQGQCMPSMSSWSQEKKPMCLIWSRSIFWVCQRALVLVFFMPPCLQKGSVEKPESVHSEFDPIIVEFSLFCILHHP